MYKKPTNFMELLELQKMLDEKTSAERANGFKPRPRTERDIRFALDDEFNEFMKELPDELNFKTWKQKEWSAERQLEEWVDCLFFIAALINHTKGKIPDKHFDKTWEKFDTNEDILEVDDLEYFKNCIMCFYAGSILNSFVFMSELMKYDKEIILNAYWSKWNKNMGRPEKDWTL